MRNYYIYSTCILERSVVRVQSHEADVDSDPIMAGSSHPVGVPMCARCYPFEEILCTWPIIRYVYEQDHLEENRYTYIEQWRDS